MPDESAPTTRRELETALEDLLQVAAENGVPVADHAYDCTHPESERVEWDVHVTETVDR